MYRSKHPWTTTDRRQQWLYQTEGFDPCHRGARNRQIDRQGPTAGLGAMGLSPSLCGAISMLRCSPATQSQSSVVLSHTHSFLVRLLMDEAVASCSDLSRSRIEVCVCGYVCVYMRPRSGSGRGGQSRARSGMYFCRCQQRLLHTRDVRSRLSKARVETQPPQSAFANAAMTRCTAAPRDG